MTAELRLLSPIDPAEKTIVEVDFSRGLTSAESIISVAYELTVVTGTDAAVASRRGTAQPDATGKFALIAILNPLAGVRYKLKAIATTNNNEKVLSHTVYFDCVEGA